MVGVDPRHRRDSRRPTPPIAGPSSWADDRRPPVPERPPRGGEQESSPYRQRDAQRSPPSYAPSSSSFQPRHAPRQPDTSGPVRSALASHADSSSDPPYGPRDYRDQRRRSPPSRHSALGQSPVSRHHDYNRRFSGRDEDFDRQPPLGPASDRRRGYYDRSTSWRDVSTDCSRALEADTSRGRNTEGDSSGRSQGRGDDAECSWRPDSPPTTSRGHEGGPQPTSAARAEPSDESISSFRRYHFQRSSSGSSRAADSDARTEARRAASRSATAHDKLAGGLVYDDDYSGVEADAPPRKSKVDEDERQSDRARSPEIAGNRDHRERRPPTPDSTADRQEFAPRPRSDVPERHHEARRRDPDRHASTPSRSWRDGQSGRLSPQEAARIPTGPRAERRYEASIDRSARSSLDSQPLSQRLEARWGPPPQAPRGPRNSEADDRPDDRRLDARSRYESGRGASGRDARLPSRDEALPGRHGREHNRSEARTAGDDRYGRSGGAAFLQGRPATNARPPPPPSATADALAYGSVSPEVEVPKENHKKRSRDSAQKAQSGRSEVRGRDPRSQSVETRQSRSPSRDDSRSSRTYDNGTNLDERHAKPSSRKKERNDATPPRKRPHRSDNHRDSSRERVRGTSPDSRSRRRQWSQTSRTPISPSRSPSPVRGGARRDRSNELHSPPVKVLSRKGDVLSDNGGPAQREGERSDKNSNSTINGQAKDAPQAVSSGGGREAQVAGAWSRQNKAGPASSFLSQEDRSVPSADRLTVITTAASPQAAPGKSDPGEQEDAEDEEEEEEEDDTANKVDVGPPRRALLSELYVRIAQVGEGTYGQVFKAKSERTNVLVALKKIRMEAEKDGFPTTAMREIKLLQMLKHQNVVRLHEIMTARGSVYMVFEYMEHDLNGVLNHPKVHFSPAHLKSLASQLLEGLGYLHHKAVLHRDLKGSNVLLNNAGLLKLADFGLARLYAKGRTGDYTNRVVTLWYRPPELLLGATQYGAEVDMWGAGCIFLELFNRRPIFQGTDEISQLQVISDLVGPLTEERWKGMESLPWWELVRPQEPMESIGGAAEGPEAQEEQEPRKRVSLFQTYAKTLTPGALHLAEALLTLDPRKRASAAAALQMDYFVKERPKARLPSSVLSSLKGEWHELESKRARQKGRA